MSLVLPRGHKLIEQIDRTELPPNAVALWHLGQSGFILKGDGKVVYLDPYLSDFLERFTQGRPDHDPRRFKPPLEAEDITNADVVFGSHYHYDHIDPGAISGIARSSPQARFVVPSPARAPLLDLGVPEERIHCPPCDEPQTIGGVGFISIPAAHESFDRDPERGYPYRGYIVELGGIHVYHAGDCVPYDGLAERLQRQGVDIALLPINGRDYFRLERGFAGNFTCREAAELAATIGCGLLVPMHFGMHMANTERPGYLVDYLAEHFPTQKFHIMTPGERVMYVKAGDEGLLTLAG